MQTKQKYLPSYLYKKKKEKNSEEIIFFRLTVSQRFRNSIRVNAFIV